MNMSLMKRAWQGLLAGGLAATVASGAHAVLPTEELTVTPLQAVDPYRLYIGDPTMTHLLDGKVHVIDGKGMKYLGQLGAGFSGSVAHSALRHEIYVIAIYHSRLQRGERTDVVEVYDADTLAYKREVVIAPKHVEALAIKALQTLTSDGRFLLIQNATPAASVSVVDLDRYQFVGEINNPGCWGVIPWQAQPSRFSTICGDGSVSTVVLDAQGKEASRSSSAPFFNPDVDPVFMHYERLADTLYFVSYNGSVYPVNLTEASVQGGKPWPLVNAAEVKQGWKPGGSQLFALDPVSQRLIVAMHPHAREGSHKNPAQALWTFDIATQRRVAKNQGYESTSMTLMSAPGLPTRLFVLAGEKNTLLGFDLQGKGGLRKPAVTMTGIGETPVYLELHQ
jgi:methylamine dehydrogenase heavy chain